MKLNFKEWSMILEAMYRKAEDIECNLRYYEEDCETRTKNLREQEMVNALISKIENFAI